MLKLRKILGIFTLFIFIIFSYTGCNREPISKEDIVLGTFCKITIYDKSSEKVLDEAFKRISEIEDEMSINKLKSELLDLSSNSGKKFVKLSDDTLNVIKRGIYYSKLSNGKFDITIGPIVKLWNIGTDKARVPSKEEIDSKKELVNYKNIVIDEKSKKVMLKKEGMLIDLGAIAKGYAADEVKKVLIKNGVQHAIINLGGNILALNTKPDNTDWNIGIQNPINARGNYLGIVKTSDKSIVTSGIYERYLEKNGKRYHHILDPKTGFPVDNPLLSVSIVAKDSIDADGLSTTVFSLGLDKGMKLIESLNNIDAIFVTKDYKVYTSSGLKNNFEIKNSKFKLAN